MIEEMRQALALRRDPKLVDELLLAYQEAKSEFYRGGLRLQAVEGGRFCEAAFRLLQEEATGSFVPLGGSLKTDELIKLLASLPKNGGPPASIRLHIPRSLRVVYDIRNNRDTAHLADGIDPNLQDATLVVGVLDWVLAEFIRLWHMPTISADEAQRIVRDLVTRRAPVVEDFHGFLKVLDPTLSHGQHMLVLLYHCGSMGATRDQLREWSTPAMRKNMSRIYFRLERELNYIHRGPDCVWITQRGIEYVDESGIMLR
ncbi:MULTISPECIES: hypothetical protein [Catenuloplanes]|uniref:Uncharacterized protein n=1 Tax=Catenuloplanes niger TaxID=587534 RepID=A0AAE3ZQV4_9ACTN|nr:hypothetical protein [Catenuloplanes niger]MDR7323304.1 hypothetical protein [Catenuloplanes niger]